MAGARARQHGIALLLMLFLLFGVGATVVLSSWNTTQLRLEKNRQTQIALQQAKAALLAYAISVYPVGNSRPGDLPCPDTNNDGKKETSCGNSSGSTGQTNRLGRLPWKDLGLPDLRDGDGERLWYAVSNNFKENTRHLPLNSDTSGTISVTDSSGTVTSNVIAIIIAPGPPLQRLNASAPQDRSSAGENNPVNYLDASANEDNADFIDSTTNGFINGEIRDTQNRLLVNDNLLVITYGDLMPYLEKQVATSVFNCLTAYAAYNTGYNNMGRYPWAADLSASALNNYSDANNTLFGRLPDSMLNSAATSANMLPAWGSIPSCTITDSWFKDNWREQVFYAVADAYKPGSTPPVCGNCLTIDGTGNLQLAVIVGRQALIGQDRSNKSIIGNYLEGENASPYDGKYQSSAGSIAFNDLLLFK
jgi:hypothetical protein